MSRTRIGFFKSAVMTVAFIGLMAMGACSTTDKAGAEDAESDAARAAEMERARQEGGRLDTYRESSELQDVYFDYDRSDIRSDQRDVLARNAEWIKGQGSKRIQVEGHCDERGTEEYNLALGERRANAIRDFLISYGVESDRIFAISYGEEMPVDPGHTESAWSLNRRAHFLVDR